MTGYTLRQFSDIVGLDTLGGLLGKAGLGERNGRAKSSTKKQAAPRKAPAKKAPTKNAPTKKATAAKKRAPTR